MARRNEYDANRHLRVTPAPRLTNAAYPTPKRRVTLTELLHGRRFASLREAIGIAVFVMCVVIGAYKFLAAADPRLP